MPSPRHIAVLGAGLTGLSSAFHLSRRFPDVLITLLEGQSMLGGWVRSEKVTVEAKGIDGSLATVVLEGGPRTLRPNAKSVLELVSNPLLFLKPIE
jgi:oxygen-dependent protoporphyrinogen oxidase